MSFNDVLQAIQGGNVTMSAGNLIASGQRRTIRILGGIDSPKALDNFVVKSEFGNAIYLKDIASVSLGQRTHNICQRIWGNSCYA